MNMKILYSLLGVVVVFVVLGNAIPILWPMLAESSTNVTGMVGTDAGTTVIKNFWPVAMLCAGLALAIGVIVYAINKFKSQGGSL